MEIEMKILTKNEIENLSFPDARVEKMQFKIPKKEIEIKMNSGYLSINNGLKLKDCILNIKEWQSINASLYRTKTKQWEKLNTDNFESLIDICEFFYGNEIIFRGFGAETGQWIEIVISKAKLVVKCE